MLRIKKHVFSPFMENTYVIWDEETKEAAVIDPGCFDDNERNELKKYIKEKGLELKCLVNTHCHLDHMFGNAFVKSTYKVDFIAPEKDLPLLKSMPAVAANYGLPMMESPLPDKYIDESENFKLGSIVGRFLFTPGHTPGEYSLYFPTENVCFTGDVLFHEGIGRTDLPGGDFNTLKASIKNKLYTLPDDTVIYPGHGDDSTIIHEKKSNPFVN